MFTTTLSVIRNNIAAYVFLIFLYLAMGWSIQQAYMPEWIQYATILSNLLLAFFAHRAVLLASPFRIKDFFLMTVLQKAGGFAARTLALTILSLSTLLVTILVVLLGNGFELPSDRALAGWYFVAIAVFPGILALLGTWLPAGVYGKEASLGAAVRRGKANFLPLFAKLMIPLWLNILVPTATVAVFLYSRRTEPTMSGQDLLDPAGSAVVAVEYMTQIISITLGAVVLSLAFAKAEGIMIPTARPGTVS